jgi:hypothetical protein
VDLLLASESRVLLYAIPHFLCGCVSISATAVFDAQEKSARSASIRRGRYSTTYSCETYTVKLPAAFNLLVPGQLLSYSERASQVTFIIRIHNALLHVGGFEWSVSSLPIQSDTLFATISGIREKRVSFADITLSDQAKNPSEGKEMATTVKCTSL